MENLDKLDKMTKAELVELIHAAQTATMLVEDAPGASPDQKEEASKKFLTLERAKGAIRGGYIATKTVLTRLFHRIKNFLSTVWTWAKGLGTTIVNAVVGAFKALANFLGELTGKVIKCTVQSIDRAVRVVVPDREDDKEAMEREALHELKRLEIDPDVAAEAATG